MKKEAMNLINCTFEKIAKEQKKNNVTARAIGSGALGAIGGGIAADIATGGGIGNKRSRQIGSAIGAGLAGATSIAKNVRHNRKLEERTAFDVVNQSFEKVADMYSDGKNLVFDPWDSYDDYQDVFDKATRMDEENGQEDYYYYGNANQAVVDEVSRFMNEHPKKQQALEDFDFNHQVARAKHKHSDKVRKAGAIIGGIAPTVLGAGAGAALGAINPKAVGAQSRGAGALAGAGKGALGSLGGQYLAGMPQVAGAFVGAGIGSDIAKKMDAKAREKMGPMRMDTFRAIEDDAIKHMSNPEVQKRVFDSVKYDKTASEIVNEVFKDID